MDMIYEEIFRVAVWVAMIYWWARYLKRHKGVYDPLKPRVWFKAARVIGKRGLLKKVAIGTLFALVAFLLVPRATVVTEVTLGLPILSDPTIYPEGQIFDISPYLLLGIVFIGSPMEEWVFRRTMLQSMLGPSRKQILKAIFVSSFAFSLIHFANPGASWGMLIPTFAAGLLFGVSYLREGFLASATSHTLYNLLAWLWIMGVI